MWKTIARRSGGVLFGILVALLAAEVALRISTARGDLPAHVPADLFVAHPIGWTLEPGLKTTIPSVGGLVQIDVNSAGFRDDDYPIPGQGDRPRLLVLGDSYTLAIETPQEQTFHARLEERYAGEVEVVSMAASGYETTQEYLAYQHIGRGYDPDLVLLMLYVGNDLVGNQSWPALPHYTLDEAGRLSLQNYPYAGDFDLPLKVSQRSTWLMRRSRLAFMVGSFARSRGQTAALEASPCEYLVASNYPHPTPDDWALTEALLLAFRDNVEADGRAFRVAILPTEFQVEPSYVDDFQAICEPPPWAEQSLEITSRLASFLAENDIAYLDLTPLLQAQRRSTATPLYLPGVDIHWTPEGHVAVAGALYDWLPPESLPRP